MIVLFGAATPSFALSPAVCGPYADKAVEQSIEYLHLGCKTGKSQWWSEDRQYHYGWCMLEPATSDAAAKGEEDREKALAECAVQIEAEAEEPQDPDAKGPKKKVAEGLECRMRFGDVEFTDDQVEGGIAPNAGGGDGWSAVCNYYHPNGTMRISSSWAVWLSDNVPGPRIQRARAPHRGRLCQAQDKGRKGRHDLDRLLREQRGQIRRGRFKRRHCVHDQAGAGLGPFRGAGHADPGASQGRQSLLVGACGANTSSWRFGQERRRLGDSMNSPSECLLRHVARLHPFALKEGEPRIPLINVKLIEGVFNDAQKKKMVTDLTDDIRLWVTD
jgi:hypothetical protein